MQFDGNAAIAIPHGPESRRYFGMDDAYEREQERESLRLQWTTMWTEAEDAADNGLAALYEDDFDAAEGLFRKAANKAKACRELQRQI